MPIETKPAEGASCTGCGRPIEGKITLEELPGVGFVKALGAAIAHKCKSCGAFLCKDCWAAERGKLRGLRKLAGFDCPACDCKFKVSISAYPADLDLDAVVAGPSDYERPQGPIETKVVTGITCEHCGQSIEGEILLEPLNAQQANQAYSALVGLKCQYCGTYLCKTCYTKAKGRLRGATKFVGVNCPHCGLQFYSPFGSNLGIYPPDVDLNATVSASPYEAPDRDFNKLLEDLGKIHDFYREGFLQDVLVRIKANEKLLRMSIQEKLVHGNPKAGLFGADSLALESNLIVMGRAGADWLLQREIIPDSYVGKLIEESRAGPKLITVRGWLHATLVLVELEIARKDGALIPAILQAYQLHTEENPFSVTIQLGRITWDERVIDALLQTLDKEVRIPDPDFVAASLGDLFTDKRVPGPAQRAAESLIAIGDERGVAALLEHENSDVRQFFERQKRYTEHTEETQSNTEESEVFS